MVIAGWFMHVRKPQSSGLGGCLVMEKSVHDTGFFFSKVYGWSLNKRPTSFRKEFVNATDDSCPFLFSSLQAKHQVLGNTYTWLWKIRQTDTCGTRPFCGILKTTIGQIYHYWVFARPSWLNLNDWSGIKLRVSGTLTLTSRQGESIWTIQTSRYLHLLSKSHFSLRTGSENTGFTQHKDLHAVNPTVTKGFWC